MDFQLNVKNSKEATASLEKVEQLQKAVTDELTQLWEQRRQILLTGTDAELVAIDQHIATTERKNERLLAAAEALGEKHETLLQTETKKAIDSK